MEFYSNESYVVFLKYKTLHEGEQETSEQQGCPVCDGPGQAGFRGQACATGPCGLRLSQL